MGTTRTELLREISTLTGIKFETLKVYAKHLPKAGLIESYGRGPWAWELSPASATILFLALFGAEKNSVVVESVKRLMSCVSNDANGRVSLSSVLKEIFSDPVKADRIGAIHICKTHPEVEIFYDDGGSWSFLMPEEWALYRKDRPLYKVWAHIDGILIKQLSLLVFEKETDRRLKSIQEKFDELMSGKKTDGSLKE